MPSHAWARSWSHTWHVYLRGLHHGPEVDMFLNVASGLDENLADINFITVQQFVVPWDSGYSWCIFLEDLFAGYNTSTMQSTLNKSMSKLYIVDEWIFKSLEKLLSFVDSKRKLEVRELSFVLDNCTEKLLTNFHKCYFSNQTLQYFTCSTPTLARYINERGN